MGNREPTIGEPLAIVGPALRSQRDQAVEGLSRRELLRRAIALGVGVWLTEVTAGTLAFMWPNLTGGFGGRVVVGGIDVARANPSTNDAGGTLVDGAPAYIPEARAFLVLLDPDRGYQPGVSQHGDGETTNVRTLYQRCTHLGCKPNFCTRNFWFECPCHGSRYDRLGIKVQELGPAPRGLDRFASSVDADGILTIDTGRITLGPLPIAIGQPGLIPPRSSTGCL